MTKEVPSITLRIPGAWAHPGELLDRLPEGYRLTPEHLRLPDGTEIEFMPRPPDDQFAGVFRSACRRAATEDELAIVDRYSVNICLSGPGGSLDAALTMMQAGAAIVQAGAAGVFIDNSGLAHGGGDWLAMTEAGESDAISFAFTAIVRGRHELYTMGMRAMGFPDVLMRCSDVDEQGEPIIEIVRYICSGQKPMDVGHVLMVERQLHFQVVARTSDEFDAQSPLHNPFGRLKIVSLKDIAEGN
jgi:hypothetical protein